LKLGQWFYLRKGRSHGGYIRIGSPKGRGWGREVLTEIRVCEARIKHKPKLDKALTHGLYAVKKSMQPSEMGGRQRSGLYIFREVCCENKTPAHGVEE
jgi:hypothetical protein